MERISQSVAKRVPLKAYLSSDHISPATGKTIAVVISKNGAAFGNPNAGATNATEIASGWYYVDLDTTDTGTVGPLIVRGTEGTIDATEIPFSVEGAIPANVTQFGGSNGTFSGGRPEVNTTHAAGTAWGSGAITSAAIASDAITAAKVHSDVSAEIADAVWDEAIAGHAGAGSTGEALSDAGGGGGLDAAGVRAAIGMAAANLDTQLGGIVSDIGDVDGRFTDSRPEPAQGAPAANTDPLSKLDFIYKLARNKITQDATTLKVFADDASTVDHKATVSDNGTTYTRGEITSGP